MSLSAGEEPEGDVRVSPAADEKRGRYQHRVLWVLQRNSLSLNPLNFWNWLLIQLMRVRIGTQPQDTCLPRAVRLPCIKECGVFAFMKSQGACLEFFGGPRISAEKRDD